jgi:hypothetical protein
VIPALAHAGFLRTHGVVPTALRSPTLGLGASSLFRLSARTVHAAMLTYAESDLTQKWRHIMEQGDEIDRAVRRNSVQPGSPLEKLVRQNFFNIVGTSEEKRDAKLDAFIVEQSANPLYADSLVSRRPPQKEKPKIDPLNLSREQFEAIAAGKLTPSP